MKIHSGTMINKTVSPAAWIKYFGHHNGRQKSDISAEKPADYDQVNLSELHLGSIFDDGAHAQLYHGNYKNESVAVKISKVPEDYEYDYTRKDVPLLPSWIEKQFYQEISILSRLDHPNVLKFVAACKQPPVLGIVTEYLSGGCLRSYLNKIEDEHEFVPLPKLITMALDIARGMAYVHSKGIVHRDLKPDNILVKEDLHLKIADFGSACEESHCHLLDDIAGTYRWMSPEMIKGKKSYNRKIDVYGFGLILFELIAGTIPFKGLAPEQVAFSVLNKNLRPDIPKRCPPAMRDLIVQCWSVKPEKRPEFWQIVDVLEQFETSFARDGTLNRVAVKNLTYDHQHKKRFPHWIQKVYPMHSDKLNQKVYPVNAT
ncbi:hypothetical protein ACH5RR_022900 [Cinchona calisaya]|uniref:Protein kinase domain-containing protein n=1 Tax=Cinchona calisaya TaxID=153742 RepID=A0ABD2Z954_9GENT